MTEYRAQQEQTKKGTGFPTKQGIGLNAMVSDGWNGGTIKSTSSQIPVLAKMLEGDTCYRATGVAIWHLPTHRGEWSLCVCSV